MRAFLKMAYSRSIKQTMTEIVQYRSVVSSPSISIDIDGDETTDIVPLYIIYIHPGKWDYNVK